MYVLYVPVAILMLLSLIPLSPEGTQKGKQRNAKIEKQRYLEVEEKKEIEKK